MIWIVRLIIVFCVSMASFESSHAQSALITGSTLISQLEATGKTLVSQGETSGSNLIRQMGEQLQTLAAQLNRTLADQVNKPITDLNDNLKIQAQRAFATLQQGQAFVESILGCTKQDAEELSTAAEGSIRQFASDTVPWVPDFPYVARVAAGGQSALLGVRTNSKSTQITIRGANLSDPRCELPVAQLEGGSGAKIGLQVISSNPESIVAVLPEVKDAGLYKLKVLSSKKRWFWFGCSQQPEASSAINVLTSAQFSTDIEVKPVCLEKESREFQVGGFGRTNSSCTNNANDNQTVSLLSVTKDGSNDWVITSDRHQDTIPNDHCSNIGPNGQGYKINADGRSIDIGVSCSPRSGSICIMGNCSCSGSGTGHTFTLWVTAQRNKEVPKDSAKDQLGPVLGFGSTRSTTLKAFCDAPVRLHSEWNRNLSRRKPSRLPFKDGVRGCSDCDSSGRWLHNRVESIGSQDFHDNAPKYLPRDFLTRRASA
ncbi:hypothetical protein ACVWXN_005980 [Bradyrhizobium sp. i1.4.4]